MKHLIRSKTLFAGLATLAINAAVAEVKPSLFRAEAPTDRPADVAAAPKPSSFRTGSDVEVRSAVAVSSAGVSNGMDDKFIPTQDAGSGIFERRPYHFTFSLNQGYDDNIYTTHDNKQGSFFTSGSIGANVKFSDGRTSLEAALSAGGSYYYDRDDSFDPDITLNVDFSHVFSPKLRLDITTYLAYQAEPDFQIGFGQNRRSGNYFYGNIGFSLAQTFTRRFSVVYGYTVGGVYYDESSIADISNRIEQTYSLQLRYLIQPTISLVGEYRFGIVTYDAANRDSTSNYALVGVDFTLNRRLTASIRAGAQFRSSDDVGDETSPFVESTLTYKYGDRSSIQWLNRYGFEESEFGFGSTRKTYRTGLTINQRVSSRISANGGVFYTTSDYSGAFGDSEQTLDLNAGLIYSVNRLLSLQTGYTYTKVYSDFSLREYDRNRIYLGATLTF
ncbi:MAG: outer membrane beta-barrel protein [Chthoniobacterales bacterium]